MWKSLLRCSVIGGIVVYLWLTLQWAVLPMHSMMINQFTEPAEITSTVTRYAPHDGIYVIPSRNEEAKGAKKDNIFVFMNIKRDVDITEMTRPMIVGVLMQMVGAFIITYLLLQAKVMRYWGRVGFVTLIGLAIAVIGVLPAWNWWHFPLGWSLLEVFDVVFGWFLGGLVIAKLIKN